MNLPMLNQSPATYFIYKDEGRVFEHIGLWNDTSVTVTGVGEPERIRALQVTEGVLDALRAEPLLGRRFTGDDDSPRTPQRVILTHAYAR
jgi:hypothetical protein